jgi:hypothetical protein
MICDQLKKELVGLGTNGMYSMMNDLILWGWSATSKSGLSLGIFRLLHFLVVFSLPLDSVLLPGAVGLVAGQGCLHNVDVVQLSIGTIHCHVNLFSELFDLDIDGMSDCFRWSDIKSVKDVFDSHVNDVL